MPTLDNIYGGNTLKAEELPPTFRAVLKIESVSVQEFDNRDEKGKTDRKLVLRFENKEKGLALNITNANMMAEVTGTRDYERWVGHHVMLYRTMTDYAGRRVPAIRLDHPTAAPQQPAPPPPPPPATVITDDDIPF